MFKEGDKYIHFTKSLIFINKEIYEKLLSYLGET